MSKFRRAARIDINQPGIVKQLREIPGVTVQPGHDDILVGSRGKTYWYEIKSSRAISKKTGAVYLSAKKKAQIDLEANWLGHYKIVSSLDEILIDIGVKTS